MVESPVVVGTIQKSVTSENLNLFGFALMDTKPFVKGLKDGHRLPRGAFICPPLFPLLSPGCQEYWPLLNLLKPLNSPTFALIREIRRGVDLQAGLQIFPPW